MQPLASPFLLFYDAAIKTRPGICHKKRRFASREAADAAALAAGVPLRTYKCGLCHQFHLTSRTKSLRPPRPQLS